MIKAIGDTGRRMDQKKIREEKNTARKKNPCKKKRREIPPSECNLRKLSRFPRKDIKTPPHRPSKGRKLVQNPDSEANRSGWLGRLPQPKKNKGQGLEARRGLGGDFKKGHESRTALLKDG